MNSSSSLLACVTGASSGIGQAYARLLAQQGYDLLLVARREDLLRALAEELSVGYGISTDTLPVDLTIAPNVARLAARLEESSNLAVLINCAGYGCAGFFSTSALPEQMGMLDLHAAAPVLLTHAALVPMLRARRGIIVNVSSLVAFFQVPSVAVYAASKRFLVDFSQSLAMEVHKDGVVIQALCPGLTASTMHDRLAFDTSIFPAFAWMTPEKVADASWRMAQKRAGVCIPGSLNQAVYLITRFIPGWMQRWAILKLEPLLLRFLQQPGTA